MGSRLGPSYAFLFMGHTEEQIFDQHPGKTPDLYKRCIDDTVGSIDEIEAFVTFANGFHPR